MISWLKEQSEVPSRMYARPSETMAGSIQPRTGSLASFYQDYSSCVVLAIDRLDRSESQLAVGQLAGLGSFFAMRSREYLKVPKAEEGRTKEQHSTPIGNIRPDAELVR